MILPKQSPPIMRGVYVPPLPCQTLILIGERRVPLLSAVYRYTLYPSRQDKSASVR